MAKYIYEHPKWTDFSWQDKSINAIFGEVNPWQCFQSFKKQKAPGSPAPFKAGACVGTGKI